MSNWAHSIASGKESTFKAEDLGLIPGLENPLEKEITIHSSIFAW